MEKDQYSVLMNQMFSLNHYYYENVGYDPVVHL